MGRKIKWTDDALIEEARKYASKAEFRESNESAYKTAQKRRLLDQLFPGSDLSEAEIIAEAIKYATPEAFKQGNRAAYNAAFKIGALYKVWETPFDSWKAKSAEEILAEGRKYSSRSEFFARSRNAYEAAHGMNLLDLLYPSRIAEWADSALIEEALKHQSSSDFERGNGGAYQTARKRGLLAFIDFPIKNAPSDNDAIYIWKALGVFFNGHPVYKVGVTSARLDDARIRKVAKAGGFEAEIIILRKVSDAYALEGQLRLLGHCPGFKGFDGCTEFRALSERDLVKALAIVGADDA